MTRADSSIRASVLRGLPPILEEHGVEATRVFHSFGVGPVMRHVTDRRIPFRTLGALLEHSSRLARCGHFGLLAAKSFQLSDTGLFGAVALNSPTVGRALSEFNRRWHLHDNAAIGLVRRVDRRRVALTYAILDGNTTGASEITDGALAMLYRSMRELAGPDWFPERVLMSRRRPRSPLPYRRFFGADVRFDAEVSALVFDDAWLSRPVAGADGELHRSLTSCIDAAGSAHGSDWPTTVRFATCSKLLAGDASASRVANHLGVSRRTLSRRLDACGTSFRELSDEVQFNLALHMLRNTSLPVLAVAESLGYADASGFSRAFHRWNGTSARSLRSAMRAGEKD